MALKRSWRRSSENVRNYLNGSQRKGYVVILAAATPITTRIFRVTGWSAWISAALSVVSGVFLFLFYGLEVPRMATAGPNAPQTFGTLNDIATLFQCLCGLPLTVALHRLAPPSRWRFSAINMAIGVVGLLGVVLVQGLLVLRMMSFDVNLPLVMAAFGLFGAWMLLANRLAHASGAFSRRLARLGQVTGLVFVLGSVIVLLGVFIAWRAPSVVERAGTLIQQNPALAGAIVIVLIPLVLAWCVAVPLWLIGVGRRLTTLASLR